MHNEIKLLKCRSLKVLDKQMQGAVYQYMKRRSVYQYMKRRMCIVLAPIYSML